MGLDFDVDENPLFVAVFEGEAHEFVNGLASCLAFGGDFLEFVVEELVGLCPVGELMEGGVGELDELWEEAGDEFFPRAIVVSALFTSAHGK